MTDTIQTSALNRKCLGPISVFEVPSPLSREAMAGQSDP